MTEITETEKRKGVVLHMEFGNGPIKIHMEHLAITSVSVILFSGEVIVIKAAGETSETSHNLEHQKLP